MNRLRTLRLAAAFAALPGFFMPGLAAATPDARAEAEIQHLVAFVAGSGCTFIRNDDAHDPGAAAGHLQMKYGKVKSRLQTTEQFIEKIASRSFLSGKPYRTRCPGKPEMDTGTWLNEELRALRSRQAPANHGAP